MTKALPLPSKEYLEECFEYDSETGKLYWKVRPISHFKNESYAQRWNNQFSNKSALNCLNSRGYLQGRLNGVSVLAHRVIYKLVHGADPEIILHTARNKENNKIESISSDTQEKNMRDMKKYKNNTSGVTGVIWHTLRNKWRLQIGTGGGKNKYLGLFENLEDAISCRKKAEVEYGYNENHGL